MSDVPPFPWLPVLGIGLLLLCAGACSTSTDERLALAGLAQNCLVNSDCSSPLVCAFQLCHAECETSRDCDDGARCVAASRPYKVCQLEQERLCSRTLDCAAGLVCGVDGQCRDRCQSDKDCVEGQLCAAGTCADIDELKDGKLEPAAGMTPGEEGAPCAYVSDCSGTLLCRSQTCLPECRADVDCGADELCVDARCSSTRPASCAYNSQCDGARGERCLAGSCLCSCVEDRDCAAGQVCNGCGCEVAPDAAPVCVYNSDCQRPGELCRNRVCSCACVQDRDCAEGLRCDGCGCVSSNDPVDGIITGNVYIQSSLQLANYAGVTEIRGDLGINTRATVSLGAAFERLRRVDGNVTIYGGAALEAVDGFPSLESATTVVVSSSQKLRTIDFPALTNAGLIVSYLPELTRVSAPLLSTGALTLSGLPKLTSVALPSFAEASAVSLQDVTALEQLALLELTRVSGNFIIDSSTPSALAQLTLPKLASIGSPSGSAFSLSNTQLSSLDGLAPGAPNVSLSYVNFSSNGQLSQCAIDAFIARCGSGIQRPANISGSLACAGTCQQGACVP